jgi:hypothetical protein
MSSYAVSIPEPAPAPKSPFSEPLSLAQVKALKHTADTNNAALVIEAAKVGIRGLAESGAVLDYYEKMMRNGQHIPVAQADYGHAIVEAAKSQFPGFAVQVYNNGTNLWLRVFEDLTADSAAK